MKKISFFRLALLCPFLLISVVCFAQVSVVNTIVDCSTPGCGSLRRAINEANAYGAATPAQPYVIDASGVTGTINLTAPLTGLSNHIVIKGPENGELIIDGGDAYRVMTINPGNVVVINNITITRGRAFDRSYTTNAIGGAGINNFGFLTLNNCVIQYCKAAPLPGSAVVSFGGAVCMQNSATLTLNDTKILNNESNGAGGGIYCQTENVLTINNSTFEGNKVVGSSNHRGAAIYIFNSNVTVNNSTFARNEALGTGSHGGAIWAQSSSIRSSSLSMTNCTVAFNFARGFAGGVGINSSAGDKEVTAVISHCTIAGNHCYNNNGTQETSTTNGGGGLRTNNTSALLTLNNSIVVGNTQGSAAASAAQLPLPSGTTQGGTGRNIFNGASSVTISETGYNTIGGPSTSPGFTFTGITSGNQSAVILYSDYFGNNTLMNNGGTTATIAISPTTGFATATQVTNLVTFDQRNLLRQRVNNAFTRGAWERNVSSPTLANVESNAALFVVATPQLPAAPVTASLTVATNNNASVSEAVVTIASGFEPGDKLELPSQPYRGLAWTYSNNTLTISGTATADLYTQVIRSILFSASAVGAGNRMLHFVAKEGSVSSNTVSRTITVNEAAPPSLSGIETTALDYSSGKLGHPVSKSILIASSFAGLQSAVIKIETGFATGDELVFENKNGIIASWDAATRQLTLAGSASVTQYQEAIRSVFFQNKQQTGVTGNRTISFAVNDGYYASNSVTRIVSVSDYQRFGCVGEKVFPIGFPLIDITKPPYNAVPNDPAKADWNTIAIKAAMNDVKVGGVKERYMIYIPVGTFYINNTLTGGTSDLTDRYYYFQGQCRENTVLRLVDGAEGFNNPAEPKVMLSFFEGSFTNNAYRNQVQNLTIHTGSGNSGAIAIKFVANNSGGIRDVTVTSAGGPSAGAAAGVTAIDLTFSLSGISLLKNIKVEGFQRAFHAARQHCTFTLDNIQITGQTSEGILVDNKPLTIRNLFSVNEVPAIRSINGGSLINVLESRLEGGASTADAIVNSAGNHLMLRGITTTGYANLLSGSHTLTSLPSSGEFTTALFSNNLQEQRKTLNQSIPDVPEVTWEYDFSKWAVIDGQANDNGNVASDFNSVVDDAPVIQAAIDEGKTFIAFKNFIDIRTRVTVGNQLRQILGNWNDVNIRQPLRNGDPTFVPGTNIAFQLENTGGILKLEGFKTPFAGSQVSVLFNNNRTEDVVLADMDYPKALFYRNSANGRAFFEMINAVKPTPSDVTDGETVGEHPIIEIKNGRAYFWSLDLEIQDFHCQGNCEPIFSNDGGNAVVIGAKMGERDGLWFGMKNGSKTEIFGAVLNVSKDAHIVPAEKYVLVNDKSDVSASMIERSGRATNSTTRAYHTKFIQERDHCDAVREFNSQYAATDNVLPLRGGAGFEAQGTVVPLYVGRYTEAKNDTLQVQDLDDMTTAAIGEKLMLVANRPSATAPVIYSLVNTAETVATLEGSEITIKGAGTVTVLITQGCDANYAATSAEKTFEVKKQEQTISFLPLGDVVYQSNPLLQFEITGANTTSGLPLSYTVSGPAVVSGNMLTITGIGPVTVTASQSGDGVYLPASTVAQSFNATTTDKEKGVKPILDCIVHEGGNQYRAWFGYKNDMSMPVYIPVGITNHLTSVVLNGQQITYFNASTSGRFQYQFSVPFVEGQTISWSVAGPDGKLRTATAMQSSSVCLVVPEINSRVNQSSINPMPQNEMFLVYPNPTSGSVQIIWNSLQVDKKFELFVFDGTGRLVIRRSGSNKKQEILDLSKMAKGVYHIQLRTGSIVQSKKIIVQ